MKQTMKYLNMAYLVAVGAIMMGCSKAEESLLPEDMNNNNSVILTTTVGLNEGAEARGTTRALGIDYENKQAVKTFAAGETMAIVYKNKSGNTVKAVSAALTDGDITTTADPATNKKSATFTFELTDPDKDEPVMYIYPAAMAKASIATDATIDEANTVDYTNLDAQNGTLGTLESSLDLATFSDDWNGTSLPAGTLVNQLAVCALTLKDNATPTPNTITSGLTQVTVSDGSNTYTVKPTGSNFGVDVIYVAIRPVTAALQYIATDGTYNYLKTATSRAYAAGNFYNLGLRMVEPDPAVPLTMEALTDGNIEVNMTGTLTTGMKYSVNNGEKTPITTATTIPVNAGDKVQFYGNGTSTQVYGNDPVVMLQGTAQTKVYGNIMSLIDETGYATLTTLPNQDYVFSELFSGNENLTDASGLLLPATTLAEGCYSSMFSGCTSLTTAPALPATTLAESCYNYMFYGCTSLSTAPALPATTLASYCYDNMFNGCTSLATAPALPATTLAESCYNYMFSGCTSLTTAPALPATELTDWCYSYMFDGCTSLATAPALPAETLASYCYFGMFSGCTSLVTAPALPATTLANSCYASMFWSCTSLVTAPPLPATTLANTCYGNMFSECTSLTTAPALPATMLTVNCYKSMFSGCTSLSSITCLATEGINENESTSDWVNGVASTGTFTKASGATWPEGSNGIPNDWTENEQ